MVTRVHYFRRYSERDKEKEKGKRGTEEGKLIFKQERKKPRKGNRSISHHWTSSSPFLLNLSLSTLLLKKRENGKRPPFVFLFLSWPFFPYQFTYFSLCRSSIDVPYFANTFHSHPPSFLLTVNKRMHVQCFLVCPLVMYSRQELSKV